MERFTISLSDILAAEFDQWLLTHGYSNRSEGVRDLLRKVIESDRISQDLAEYSIATISYVYNHHERCLSERLTALQHEAHDLVISSTHVHLDHDNCLESVFLRGSTKVIQQFAQNLSAESGVRHSVINLIPVKVHIDEHHHAHDHHDHTHDHKHDHEQHVHIHPLS